MIRTRRLYFLTTAFLLAFPAALILHVYAAQDSGPARDAWQRPEEVMTALALVPGSRVADVGAGDGYFVRHLARRVGDSGRVFAVDIDEKELDKLRRALKDEKISNVEIIRSSTSDPKLPAASLDAILVVNAYHEMREADPMMRGFLAALKPASLLAIIDAAGDESLSRESHFSAHTIPASLVRSDAERNHFHFLREEPGFTRTDSSRRNWFFLIFQKPPAP